MKIFKLFSKEGRENIVILTLFVAVAIALGCILYGVVTYYKETSEATTLVALDKIGEGDLTTASVLLKKAGADGDPTAIEYLAWMETRRGNYNRALEYARQCSTISPVCLEIMGDLALLGYGEAQGVAAALSYFEQAAQKGPKDKIAQNRIDILERAFPLAKEAKDYERLVEAALKAGSARANLLMGDMLFLGTTLERNPVEAFSLWQNAKEQGISEANTRLAGAYWHGYGVKRDPKTALQLYHHAADAGDPVACYSLGLISLRQVKDHDDANDPAFVQAKLLLDKAANKNYGPAASALGILLLHERQSEIRLVQAAQWFNTAYQQMDTTGSILYALMLYAGLGMEVNEELALSILYEEEQNGSNVAGDLLSALAHNSDAKLIFDQTIEVCAHILFGEIAFRDGAFEAQLYHDNGDHAKVYYHAPNEEDEKVIAQVGSRYPRRVVNPRTFMINGHYLLLPSIGGVIVQSAPSTGARVFRQLTEPPHPPVPPVPPGYTGDPLRLEYGF